MSLELVASNLRQLHEALAPNTNRVYVEGAWVDRVPTLPLDRGAAAIVRFAHDCWQRILEFQRADQHLEVAEQALQRYAKEQGLSVDLALALAEIAAVRDKL